MEEKKKKRRTGKTFWHREATNVLKAAIERKGVAYKSLADRLDKLGIQEDGKEQDVRALRNKINRGSYSFIFYLQCLHALGYTESDFELEPLPSSKPK